MSVAVPVSPPPPALTCSNSKCGRVGEMIVDGPLRTFRCPTCSTIGALPVEAPVVLAVEPDTVEVGIAFDAAGRGDAAGSCPFCSKSGRGVYLADGILSCSSCDRRGTIAAFAAARTEQEAARAVEGTSTPPATLEAVPPPPGEKATPKATADDDRAQAKAWAERLNALEARFPELSYKEAGSAAGRLLLDCPAGVEFGEASETIGESLSRAYPDERKAEYAKNAKTDAAVTGSSSPTWESLPTLDHTLASMPPRGERLATGIPTLDKCSRGGFVRGRVYTFLGPPGKGKTILLAQIGRRFAVEYGAIVIGLFCDEGAWQAATMILEGSGFERKDVEDSYSDIRADAVGHTGSLKIRLPDPDSPETFLANVETWLADVDPTIPIVIAVDSVQVVRALAGDAPESAKERADVFMTTARRVARKLNAIVLLAAKANRAAWANKKPADNVNPLAAGLDSSRIEYDSDAVFFLAGDPDELMYVVTCKNRPGTGKPAPYPLRFNRDRATFFEIDRELARADADSVASRAAEQESSEVQAQILRVIDSTPPPKGCPGLSGTFLADACGGLSRAAGKPFRNAIAALVDGQKILEAVIGPRGIYYCRKGAQAAAALAASESAAAEAAEQEAASKAEAEAVSKAGAEEAASIRAAILRTIKETTPRDGEPGLSARFLSNAAGGLSRAAGKPFQNAIAALTAEGVLEGVPGPRGGTYYRRIS